MIPKCTQTYTIAGNGCQKVGSGKGGFDRTPSNPPPPPPPCVRACPLTSLVLWLTQVRDMPAQLNTTLVLWIDSCKGNACIPLVSAVDRLPGLHCTVQHALYWWWTMTSYYIIAHAHIWTSWQLPFHFEIFAQVVCVGSPTLPVWVKKLISGKLY